MKTTDAAPVSAFPGQSDFDRAVAEMCVRVPVSAGAAGLARELVKLSPQLFFRDVLTRGGWYRLGGVIDTNGLLRKIADEDAASAARSAREIELLKTIYELKHTMNR